MFRLVRCNMCARVFDESKIGYNPEDNVETCPYCHRSGYLMDLSDVDDEATVKVCDIYRASFSDGTELVSTLKKIYELFDEKESYVSLTFSPLTRIEKIGDEYIVFAAFNGFHVQIGKANARYLDAVRVEEDVSQMDYYKLLEICFGLKGESTK